MTKQPAGENHGKMGQEVERAQPKPHVVTIGHPVPEEHFLRNLEAAPDVLLRASPEGKAPYSRRYGRPPIDPAALVKRLLVGCLYGIPSEQQIEQRVQTGGALRWYPGPELPDLVPERSAISQLRRQKPSFGRCSGGCLRRRWGSASGEGWCADGWRRRLPPV